MASLHPNIAIIGGGIAGLWLLNRLQQAGYSCVLLENRSLGGAQSIKSQGIIHGGTKYALTGSVTTATQAISAMPGIWRDCLAGHGEVDLSAARILSPHHYLWSAHTLAGKLATFFASRAVSSKVNKSGAQTPEVFLHPQFKGSVYELDEIVLDVPSVISALAQPLHAHLIKTEGDYAYTFDEHKNIKTITATCNGERVTIEPKAVVLTAGEGNEALISQLQLQQPMQRRPLHMVVMKAPNLPHTFAHCLSGGTKPRITITTHPTSDGQCVWYLGGDLAELGVERSMEEQINCAKKELTQLLPWVDISTAQWATFHINRAEPAQNNLLRPDTAFATAQRNMIVTWPTKLALAPSLSNQVLELLAEQNIIKTGGTLDAASLPKPCIGQAVWEELF